VAGFDAVLSSGWACRKTSKAVLALTNQKDHLNAVAEIGFSMSKKSVRNSAALSAASTAGDRLLSTREVCERLHVSPKTLQRECARGAISYIRLSSTLFRFRLASVDYYIAKREIKAAA